MKQVDILAKLLAEENIIIVRESAHTASFDLKSRVLTIPLLKAGTSDVIEEMVIVHEVGHAKHTTTDMWEEALKTQRFANYVNIVEDVRIERLMRNEYPGVGKSLVLGYGELNALNFFLAPKTDVTKVSLIDRINLYYKVGAASGVQFTDEEYTFVERCSTVNTPQEVLDLAREIFKYSKEKSKKQKANNTFGDTPSDDDSKEGSEDSSGYDDSKEGSENSSEYDAEIDSITYDNMHKNLGNLINNNSGKTINYVLNTNFSSTVIVDWKTILADTRSIDQFTNSSSINKFLDQNSRSVSLLIKEFEMKKSAKLNKKIHIAKSGSINVGKLFQYQLKDDIFKRNLIVPQGKNHGMVMLIDWSYSMLTVIHSVIQQTISLATFCRRMQIPFEVFAFTTSYNGAHNISGIRESLRNFESTIDINKFKPLCNGDGNFNLLNLLSSKMNESSFNTMVKRLLTSNFTSMRRYGLGGTPLNESLVFLCDYLPKFKISNRIEKMTLVTMTDGEGSSLSAVKAESRSQIYDPLMKISYMIGESDTHVLLKIIRNRCDLTSVGYHILDGHITSHVVSVYSDLPIKLVDSIKREAITKMRDGVTVIPSPSRDLQFLIFPSGLAFYGSSDKEINSSLDVNEVSTILSNQISNIKGNKIILQKFIDTIA